MYSDELKFNISLPKKQNLSLSNETEVEMSFKA